MAFSSITSWQIDRGISGNSHRFYFHGLQNHCRWLQKLWNWKILAPWKESCDKPRQHIKKQRHNFADKDPYGQSCGFSSSKKDCKESWAPKNWCSQTVVLERTLESALDRKVINPVNPKGNKPWMFTGRTNAEAETLALWPPDAKSQIIGKDHWKDWGQEDKGETDGWMASLTQWTCIWASSGRWWRTGKPGVLPSVGSQRVGHDWATQASLVAETVKNPPAMWEIWVWSLGWEDPLEEGMATHSSFLAWRTHKKNHKESDMTEWLSLH